MLADYPVDFVGGGWSELAETTMAKSARFLGPLPFDAERAGLGSYLGAVSLNPNAEFSMHDRVFFSLGAGTVPIFDANQFSRWHLPLLSRFSFAQDPDSLRAAVETVLADPAAAQAATAATFAEIYPRFSMRRSVEDICEILTQLAGAGAEKLLPAEPFPAGVWTPQQLAKAVA
ncbi:glycosyltransferase [Bradyrhizobium sp. STM 3562]|uniref:glycosyltransferase family protein n=1 Tax=Bradyrhizobium sp. STM 3562 TaxID=578924 RepID=UPI0038907AE9